MFERLLPAEEQQVPSFGEFAEGYVASIETGWRNEVHRQQWRKSLRDHAAKLRETPVDQIGTDDVLEALRPILAC